MFGSFLASESPATQSTTTKGRRSQVARACDSCRLHRVKCDNNYPCRNCSAKGWDCSSTRRGHTSWNLSRAMSEIDRLRARVSELEAQLRGANIEPSRNEDRTPLSSDRSPSSLDLHTSDGVQLDTTTTIQPSAVNTQFYGPSSTYYFIHCISSHLKAYDQQSSELQSPQALIPNSASRSMVHAMCSPDSEPEQSSASDATSPAHELTERVLSGQGLSATQEAFFLDLFWDSWHCCYQLLDQTEFTVYYKSLWADSSHNTRKPSALVDIVLALCMQFGVTSLPQQVEPGIEINMRDAAIAGRWLYQRCQKLMVYELERPSLETVQCQLWSAVYLANASYQNMAQNMLGVAARTAYTLGLHIEPNTNLPAKEREARKRTWCTLLLFETRSCIRLGRPWVTQTAQISSILPTEDQAPIANGVTWLSYTTQRTKLMRIARTAFDEVFNHRPFRTSTAATRTPSFESSMTEARSKAIADGMESMRAWAEAVPRALKTERRGDGKPLSTDLSEIDIEPFAPLWLLRQRLMLELGYHEFMLTIGRSCIGQSLTLAGCKKNPPSCTVPGTLKAAEISTRHAAATTQLLHQVYTKHDILDGWYEPFNCQWNAAITLVGFLLSFGNDNPTASTARKALSQGIEVLERMSDFFGTAASATIVMKRLYQRASLPPRMSEQLLPEVNDDNTVDASVEFGTQDTIDFNDPETIALLSQDLFGTFGTFGTTSELDELVASSDSHLFVHGNSTASDDTAGLGLWNYP